MKCYLPLFALGIVLVSCPQAGNLPGTAMIADHTVVADFDSLSDTQLAAAMSHRTFLQHASVGSNLANGLAAIRASNSAKFSMALTSSDSFATVKAALAAGPGWGDFAMGNPGWSQKIANFRTNVETNGIGSIADVAMMKLCFIDNDAVFATYRDAMLYLEGKYPAVRFVWWTMPIETTGSAQRDAFNTAVRDYVQANGKILYDIADIESHAPDGTAQSDSNGATLYAGYNNGDGGHPDTPLGEGRLAKAMWVLLASF